MKSTQLLILLLLTSFYVKAQIVTVSPKAPKPDGQEVVITFDATLGNGELTDADKVYMHSGVVIEGANGTSWEYVIGNWGQDDGIGLMTKVAGEDNKWQLSLSPDIRSYYNVPQGEPIYRLSMVFRNADGTKAGRGTPGTFEGGFVADNQDIYVDIPVTNFIRFTSPTASTVFLNEGENVTISGETNKAATTLKLSADSGNGFQELTSQQGAQNISFSYPVVASGPIKFKLEAQLDNENLTSENEVNFVIRNPNKIAELPSNLTTGINYFPEDPTKVGLVLIAPQKETVYVVGDFTDWQVQPEFQMNKTPDGEKFWIEFNGLEAGKEYAYQYWIDDIKIGDPYADKVADPWNDSFIPDAIYPNLLNYTRTDYGVASVLQTAQQPYEWKFPEVVGEQPANEDLIIYELLVRDFLGSHSYQDLTDTLSYLKRLGVNAIELMPIMEFEGNESWGYNPSYFFAPDKYYGSKNDLKKFIDKAHEEGFVVLLDMVLNHAFGQNSMVRMYWDNNQNKPAANSPWFNPEAPHPFNVGYDFNHESEYTKSFIDTVNQYWLNEYNFDGYRFDLSKGFTQKKNPNDVGAWSNYDASRIAILKRMADKIWEKHPQAYVTLEHLAVNQEEKELAEYGMMLWGNMHFDYADALKGNENKNINGALAKSRGWNVKHLISYMESHDEERLVFINKQSGESEGNYHIKDPILALERVKLGAAFLFPLPGPKMFWQFGELGYDLSINGCPPDGQVIDPGCRIANKPIPWGSRDSLNYHQDPQRIKLYKTFSALINLRLQYKKVFSQGAFNWVSSGKMRKISIIHPELDLVIIGNFGTSEGSINPSFTKPGNWYSYFEGGSMLEVSDVNAQIALAPGEFKVFTSKQIETPETGLLNVFKPIVTTNPTAFKSTDEVTFTFDATAADRAGTNGLVGAESVFMVAGLVTDSPNGSELQFTKGEGNDTSTQMQKVDGESNIWQITFTPKDFFGVDASTNVFRIGMYFRDATGSNLGKGVGGSTIYISVTPDGKIVTTNPEQFMVDDEVKVVFDATLADNAGTAGLVGSNKVYMHSGVVTESANSTSWNPTYVIGNWGQDDGIGQMSKVAGETNKWEITITPRSYYTVPFGTRVYRLGMVFRNANGSAEGKGDGGNDLFVEVQEGEVTALKENPIFEGLIVYPNPTEGKLGVLLPKQSGKNWELRLYDLTGKKLYDTTTNASITTSYQMDLSSFKNGLYILEVATDGKSTVRKISVRR